MNVDKLTESINITWLEYQGPDITGWIVRKETGVLPKNQSGSWERHQYLMSNRHDIEQMLQTSHNNALIAIDTKAVSGCKVTFKLSGNIPIEN